MPGEPAQEQCHQLLGVWDRICSAVILAHPNEVPAWTFSPLAKTVPALCFYSRKEIILGTNPCFFPITYAQIRPLCEIAYERYNRSRPSPATPALLSTPECTCRSYF